MRETGSHIKPLTFISTAMRAPGKTRTICAGFSRGQAPPTISPRSEYADACATTTSSTRPGAEEPFEVDPARLRRPPRPFPRVSPVGPFHQDPHAPADPPLVPPLLNGLLQGVQPSEALELHLLGQVGSETGGDRSGADRVGERVHGVELDLFEERQRLLEVAFGLRREADDDVGPQAQLRHPGAQTTNFRHDTRRGRTRAASRARRRTIPTEPAGEGTSTDAVARPPSHP